MAPNSLVNLQSSFEFNGWNIRFSLRPDDSASDRSLRTIIFIHGTPWSSVVFEPLAQALLATGKNRVLLYDLPGYGQSQQYTVAADADQTSMFDGDTSVKTQANAFTALVEHLQLFEAPPIVIAHDIAGSIALRAHLLHHRVNFDSLLLMDTNAILPWGDGFYKLVRSNPQVFIDLPPQIFESVVRAVIRSASASPETFPRQWEDLLAQPWLSDCGQLSFVRQIAQANDGDIAEMLGRDSDSAAYSRVRCPAKLLWGSHDSWIPRAKMVKLDSMLPDDQARGLIEIADAGHLIMVDQPERVVAEVIHFLEHDMLL